VLRRPLKKAHLRRWLRRSSLQRTSEYVSLLASSPPCIWTFLSSLRLAGVFQHPASRKGFGTLPGYSLECVLSNLLLRRPRLLRAHRAVEVVGKGAQSKAEHDEMDHAADVRNLEENKENQHAEE